MNLQQHLRSERALRLAGLVACGVLLFLAGLIMCPPMQENEADATTGQATPATSSVTLSIADGPLSFDLKPISPDGTFAESDAMEITASTDSYSGYTLSIAAQNGDNATKLINTDTTNCPVTETKCFIAPLGSIVTKSDYASPADSTAAAAVKNTWGFSPSEYLDGGTSVDNSATDGTEKYLPISTSATNLAKTTVANSSDASDTYRMKIGARVGGDIMMGTYENTFVIAAVGNGAAYTINYADGSGQADPSSMPGTQTGTSYETTIALSNVQPTRAGYYFAGWCSMETSDTSCGGTVYQPGGNFGIDQTANDNTIKLYAMWTDCQAGTICYKGNGNTGGSMGVQNVGTSATEVMLLASNFQRTDYGFLGWSTVENPVIGTDTIYGPMETVSGLDLSISGMKLYAVWKEASTTQAYLQDWTGCSNLMQVTYSNGVFTVSANSFIALKDKRDNQTYAVARLADGNCWMIENLRLDTAGTVGNNINDSNVTNQSLAQGYGGVFNGLADPENANFSENINANSLYYSGTQSGGTASVDIGTDKYPDYRMPRYRNASTASPTVNPTTNNNYMYSYGNYYTWAAAIADTTYYGSTNDHTTVETSICPKGWHLPYGNSGSSGSNLGNTKGGYYYLNQQMSEYTNGDGLKEFRSFPNNFLFSGVAYLSDINYRGSHGYYWSSSANNATYAYSLYLDSSDLYPGTFSAYKFFGFPVRCVVGS